jgi:hypothetical protein
LRKLAAILLLNIYAFNVIGYKLVFYFQQIYADREMISALDKGNYNEADLLTIRIPLSLPYQIDRSDFERVDGEINLHGNIYKYVKRKVEHGELVLLCLPDYSKMEIQNNQEEFFKLANEFHQSKNSDKKSGRTSEPIKNLSKHTISIASSIRFYDCQNSLNHCIRFVACLPCPNRYAIDHPPQPLYS